MQALKPPATRRYDWERVMLGEIMPCSRIFALSDHNRTIALCPEDGEPEKLISLFEHRDTSSGECQKLTLNGLGRAIDEAGNELFEEYCGDKERDIASKFGDFAEETRGLRDALTKAEALLRELEEEVSAALVPINKSEDSEDDETKLKEKVLRLVSQATKSQEEFCRLQDDIEQALRS